jgi:Fic family protein
LAVPQLISELFDEILTKAREINDPFEQAFFTMVHLPYLQPFDDVNKRVSRLAANIPFIQHNLSPLSFVDMPVDLYIQSMIAIYELNRVDLLRDVFIWAYERSAVRYAAIRQSLGEPDPFRLNYREKIKNLIAHVVNTCLSPKDSTVSISEASLSLPENERQKFVELVERELLSLHEGNIARYSIRLSFYKKWQSLWSGHAI